MAEGMNSNEGGNENKAKTTPSHIGKVKIDLAGRTADVSSGPGHAGLAPDLIKQGPEAVNAKLNNIKALEARVAAKRGGDNPKKAPEYRY